MKIRRPDRIVWKKTAAGLFPNGFYDAPVITPTVRLIPNRTAGEPPYLRMLPPLRISLPDLSFLRSVTASLDAAMRARGLE